MLTLALRPGHRILVRHVAGARLAIKLDDPWPSPRLAVPRVLLRGSGYLVGPRPLRAWTGMEARPGASVLVTSVAGGDVLSIGFAPGRSTPVELAFGERAGPGRTAGVDGRLFDIWRERDEWAGRRGERSVAR